MDAIILAGGFGTRLQQTVPDVPKPLAPIQEIPFLMILLNFIAKCPQIDRVILALGYKAESICHFCEQHSFPFTIDYSIESSPLGTGGAVKLALQKTQSPCVAIFNGDSFFSINLCEMIERHNVLGAHLTIACAFVPDTSRFGAVTLQDHRITAFHEKKLSQGAGWVNGGIYLLDKSFALPEAESFSLEKDVFSHSLDRPVFGYCGKGNLIDIGTKESYLDAQHLLSAYT